MRRNFAATAAIAAIGLMFLNGCSDKSANSQSGPSADNSDSTESAENSAALPSGILSATDLSSYARYRLTYKNTDQYSKEPTDTVLNGRKFHLEIRQDKTDPALSFPLSIEYNPEKRVIDYQVYNLSSVSSDENDVVNYIPIYENDTEMSSEIMENAFGVKKEITYVKK